MFSCICFLQCKINLLQANYWFVLAVIGKEERTAYIFPTSICVELVVIFFISVSSSCFMSNRYVPAEEGYQHPKLTPGRDKKGMPLFSLDYIFLSFFLSASLAYHSHKVVQYLWNSDDLVTTLSGLKATQTDGAYATPPKRCRRPISKGKKWKHSEGVLSQ